MLVKQQEPWFTLTGVPPQSLNLPLGPPPHRGAGCSGVLVHSELTTEGDRVVGRTTWRDAT